MDTHVRVLGVLNIAVGVVGFISASAESEDAALAVPILSIVGGLVVAVVFAFSVPSVVTGIGLLYFKPWARILGIVLSAIALLGFPWITLLGIYGLWVLFNKDTERLFTVGSTA
jgi:protein-S-isoprenylcysteine O-methyltransferase Ste14